ncbi:NUDIX domain-containing protein [Gilvimarinus sp. SDUM040013]|uniref:ADP-ribose pyrophosphatase n=1 Tax=Gilvimarinus gilvus TaxID=3058038 RepID=A0ABU4RV49_9GAMM|nr:NUDIX domain-containing protein [Gilvimarinus sp. SDUM040013]MDO3387883.1 NUDIX domain-containing protein [Gilvimarinus sp. SDUM040013]MDX6848746.1 NUDIX domain-containing protein [Gilvimarinus sp. SDUM040013]
MPKTAPQFALADVEILARQGLYRGFFRAEKVTLRHRLFRDSQWSQPLSREIVYHKEAVGVLLYDPARDEIALVEQFRIGAMAEASGPWCLEVVAGMVEAGEVPDEVARRELMEEAGIDQVELNYIGNYLASPGGCDEKLHLYCGVCDLANAGGIFGLAEENEDIKVHVLAADEVFATLFTGRWNNPAALITLQWLQYNRESLIKRCEG